jgi:hypothetical protein
MKVMSEGRPGHSRGAEQWARNKGGEDDAGDKTIRILNLLFVQKGTESGNPKRRGVWGQEEAAPRDLNGEFVINTSTLVAKLAFQPCWQLKNAQSCRSVHDEHIMEPSDALHAFRCSLYECLHRRGDALFELTDAILTAGSVPSPPHLSLAKTDRLRTELEERGVDPSYVHIELVPARLVTFD